MERLSWRDKQGIAHAPVAKPCLISFTGISSDRLAAYEDTGLTPEEITLKITDYDHTQKVADGQAEQNQRLRMQVTELQERQRWIPVSEKPPEPGERVLCAWGPFVGEGYLTNDGTWCRHTPVWTESPTHWMPLPKAPKEENDA